jgi:uncharacterized membrane protein
MTEKMYTEAEAQLMADRAAMKTKMDDMASRVASTEQATKEGFNDIKVQISGLSQNIEKQMLAEDGRREMLRVDFAKEFATKMEMQLLAHKVDTMWVKITVTVSSVVAVLMGLQYLLFQANTVKHLIGS